MLSLQNVHFDWSKLFDGILFVSWKNCSFTEEEKELLSKLGVRGVCSCNISLGRVLQLDLMGNFSITYLYCRLISWVNGVQ